LDHLKEEHCSEEPACSSEFGNLDDEISRGALKLRRERVAQLSAEWKQKVSQDKDKWDQVLKKNLESAKRNARRSSFDSGGDDSFSLADSWRKKSSGTSNDGVERYSALILGLIFFGVLYFALRLMRSEDVPV
jgi:hypothetical protein